MDFQSLNHVNVTVNTLSGNCLPVSNKKATWISFSTIYSIIVWLIQLTYLTACILGIFYAPKERALKDSTVNIVISLEGIVLVIYLHSCKKSLWKLIETLNDLLATDNDLLRNLSIGTVKPLEKLLKIYTIASVTTLILWTSTPFFELFRRNEFYYTDYRVPAVLSKQPFSANVFIVGVFLQIFGSAYTILRKIGLDLYTMHLILLMTAQYKYLRGKFALILSEEAEILKSGKNTVSWRIDAEEKMRILYYHYKVVIKMSITMRTLLSTNIVILYINNVFKFCFLSLMFVTSAAVYFEKFLIVLYTISALTQLYILCSCVEGLLKASVTVASDALHEKWYLHDVKLQRNTIMIMLANKLECRLSSFRNIDLTLPSFMSILNQAYSVSLLFLKMRRD